MLFGVRPHAIDFLFRVTILLVCWPANNFCNFFLATFWPAAGGKISDIRLRNSNFVLIWRLTEAFGSGLVSKIVDRNDNSAEPLGMHVSHDVVQSVIALCNDLKNLKLHLERLKLPSAHPALKLI